MSEDASAEEMMAAKEAAMNSAECTRSRVSALESGASWYGSIRAGVEFGNGTIDVRNGGSRFGVKGSNEISEGLSAVYRFEQGLDSSNATLGKGRLAYVGLATGMGTITVGQIWSASFNHVGAITDPSWFYGGAETTYRHGNAVSYAVSSGPVSMQLDAIMDDKSTEATKDTIDVDQVEFGISMNVADVATIAFAHIKRNNELDAKTGIDEGNSNFFAVSTDLAGYSAHIGWSQHDNDYHGAGDDPTALEDSTLFAGLGGSLGDTGVGFAFQIRSKEVQAKEAVAADDAEGIAGVEIGDLEKTNPWFVNVTKSMGGGALLILEHGNADEGKDNDSKTALVLKVDF